MGDFGWVYNTLAVHGPLYACFSSVDGVGHMVVITGIDFEEGLVYSNNPLLSEPSVQSFNDFYTMFIEKEGQVNLLYFYTYSYSTNNNFGR